MLWAGEKIAILVFIAVPSVFILWIVGLTIDQRNLRSDMNANDAAIRKQIDGNTTALEVRLQKLDQTLTRTNLELRKLRTVQPAP